MKKLLLLFIFFISFKGFSQDLNTYQYAIVPAKFDFLKENDKYKLNTLTKLLMEKYGFKSFLTTDILPEEIANTNCNKIFVEVTENSNMFTTKLKVILKDCKNSVLFISDEGTSREKDLAPAFTQALRAAFKSFDKLNHKYNGETAKDAIVETKEVVVLEENFETPKPVETPVSNPEIMFFAQPIANGFQIVNNEPRVIMRLFNTSQKNVFIGRRDDTQGVVIFKNNQWFFEYYEKGTLVSEPLKVKFY